jgi:hypothetical protein
VALSIERADCDVEMAQHYTKRLSDKILIAFHQACDVLDLEDAKAAQAHPVARL